MKETIMKKIPIGQIPLSSLNKMQWLNLRFMTAEKSKKLTKFS